MPMRPILVFSRAIQQQFAVSAFITVISALVLLTFSVATSWSPNTADANTAPMPSFTPNQPVLGQQRPPYVELPRQPGFRVSWAHETPETLARAIAAEEDSSTSDVSATMNQTSRKGKIPADKPSMRASTKGPLFNTPDPYLQAPDMDLFLSDILCFLPRYFSRPGVMERMIKAKLTSPDIAKYINWCRNTQVKHHMIYNGLMLPVTNNKGLRDTSLLVPTTDFRVASDDLTKRALKGLKDRQDKDEKQSREIPSFSVSVIELAEGVFRWPKGRFLTPFAAAVKHCVITKDTTWTLETLPKIAAELGTPMPQLHEGEHYDIVFAAWVKKHLQRDHSCPECTGEPWEEEEIRKLNQGTELEKGDEHSLGAFEERNKNYHYANGVDENLQNEEQSDYPLRPVSHDNAQQNPQQALSEEHHKTIQDEQTSLWLETKTWDDEFSKWEEQFLA